MADRPAYQHAGARDCIDELVEVMENHGIGYMRLSTALRAEGLGWHPSRVQQKLKKGMRISLDEYFLVRDILEDMTGETIGE